MQWKSSHGCPSSTWLNGSHLYHPQHPRVCHHFTFPLHKNSLSWVISCIRKVSGERYETWLKSHRLQMEEHRLRVPDSEPNLLSFIVLLPNTSSHGVHKKVGIFRQACSLQANIPTKTTLVCYMGWVRLSLQNSCIESPKSNMMVFRGKAFWSQLGLDMRSWWD